jgi:hypothetical protein
LKSKVQQMIKITSIILSGILFLFSCNGLTNKEEEKVQIEKNQVVITAKGDSLENGFWKYDIAANGVSKRGNYAEGYKVNQWTYKTNLDSVQITWNTFNDKGVKFNIPNFLEIVDSLKLPVLFQGDIDDGDNNTYVILLKYNLKEINSSLYGYLYQLNEALETDPSEVVNSKEFKKFTFKKIEVVRVKVETKKEIKYKAISYVFVVKDFLYDLSYKNVIGKDSAINLEIFNDILYSMNCESVDLFDYNSKKYLKEENVEFERNPVNQQLPKSKI